jgi:hypothetical protein
LGSLIRDDERIWRNPLFEIPPLSICNQEERTSNKFEIGVEEKRVEQKIREVTNGEEDEVNNTS